MRPIREIILIYLLLMLTIHFAGAIKIGISKPLPSTTMMPINTTLETLIEETSTDAASSTTTAAVTKTTTTEAITPEIEWPEFPPKKASKTLNKTTTEKPITTTNKPSTTTINPNDLNNNTIITNETETSLNSFSKWPSKQKYCFCDLTKDSCDINCCCDHDCPFEAFKTFRCRLETSIDLEILEGRLEDFKFQHGLPSCEVNDGWLCVFRTYKPVVKKEAYFLKDTSQYYKWPNFLLESEDEKRREFYKFGDLLKIINVDTKEIQNFDLPSSFHSSFCRIQKPIYHLKPSKRTCRILSYENLKEAELKLLQFEKYKIFNTPIIPDDLYNNKRLDNFIGNITIYKCFEGEHYCTQYKHGKENTINFKLFKVKVNILHNFTNIHNIVLQLWLEDVKEEEYFKTAKQDIWLSYETEFINKTLREFNTMKSMAIQKSSIVSGPLGYLQGKPLIIARYEPFNKSQPLTTNNQVINYFLINNTKSHTLSLLAKENGQCKRFKTDQELISYGINVAKYCKIKLENDTLFKEKPSNTNFTEICLNLQQRIHEQLFGQNLIIEDLSSYFISQFGKPQNVSNKWLQLQVFNTDFESVIGQYLHETNTFICRNILLSLAYEFHMATLMVDNIPSQNVINHAVLHLAERHDLEFSLNENLEVPVTMTVRFFDVHEKAVSAGYSFKTFNLDLNFINLKLILCFCIISSLIISLY